MTIASRLSLVVLLGLAGAACSGSSNKNDGSVYDTSSEAHGGRPNLIASPTMLGFGRVCPGDVTAPRTVRVMNVGDVAAFVDVRVTASEAGDFTITATDCARLAPGEACTVTLVFAPTAESPGLGSLTVSAIGGNSINISLNSTSTGGPAPFSLFPTQSDFGRVALGATSSPVTFTVAVSDAPPSCARDAAVLPFIVKLSSDVFLITSDTCSGNDMPIGKTCSFSVVFRPTADGARYASLAVGWPSYVRTYGLTGTGTSFVDAALPEPMDSGVEHGQ